MRKVAALATTLMVLCVEMAVQKNISTTTIMSFRERKRIHKVTV